MSIDTERLPATGQWHYVSSAEPGTVCLNLRYEGGYSSAERIAYSPSGKAARSTAEDHVESSDLAEVLNWLKAQHASLDRLGWVPMRRSGSALRIDLTAAPVALEATSTRPPGAPSRTPGAAAFGVPTGPIASLGMRLYGGPRTLRGDTNG